MRAARRHWRSSSFRTIEVSKPVVCMFGVGRPIWDRRAGCQPHDIDEIVAPRRHESAACRTRPCMGQTTRARRDVGAVQYGCPTLGCRNQTRRQRRPAAAEALERAPAHARRVEHRDLEPARLQRWLERITMYLSADVPKGGHADQRLASGSGATALHAPPPRPHPQPLGQRRLANGIQAHRARPPRGSSACQPPAARQGSSGEKETVETMYLRHAQAASAAVKRPALDRSPSSRPAQSPRRTDALSGTAAPPAALAPVGHDLHRGVLIPRRNGRVAMRAAALARDVVAWNGHTVGSDGSPNTDTSIVTTRAPPLIPESRQQGTPARHPWCHRCRITRMVLSIMAASFSLGGSELDPRSLEVDVLYRDRMQRLVLARCQTGRRHPAAPCPSAPP